MLVFMGAINNRKLDLLKLLLVIILLGGCQEEDGDENAGKTFETKVIEAGFVSQEQFYNDNIIVEKKILMSNSEFGNAYRLTLDLNDDNQVDFELEYHHIINGENSYSKTYQVKPLSKNSILSNEDLPALFLEGENISTESATGLVDKHMYFISVTDGNIELEEGNWENNSNSGYLGFMLFTEDDRYVGWINLTLNPNGLEVMDAAYW